jgi:sialic acid synthase SpsE
MCANKQAGGYPDMQIGRHKLGQGHPVYIVAEVGINHNGSLENGLSLVDAAVEAGCDAVKFQKRSPDHCVPEKERCVSRDTPWGRMSYLEYRHRIEFGIDEYKVIDRHCKKRGIEWFASCWDINSVDFIKNFHPKCYKIASACLTDHRLLRYVQDQGTPVILSTGMSTMAEITDAVSILDDANLLVVHTTSNYNGDPEELNLSMIHTLRNEFGRNVGYSGHENGIIPTIAAVAMGICYVERHITIDRQMWGSDHSISLEPDELKMMVRHIRLVEQALGDGVKRVYDSEKPMRTKLRCK